jgi:hypothetical protein
MEVLYFAFSLSQRLIGYVLRLSFPRSSVGMQLVTLQRHVHRNGTLERPGLHSHGDRGNDKMIP